MEQESPSLTPKDVARRLGVSTRIVLNLVKEKKIRAVRHNQRIYRFYPSEIDRYLREWTDKEYRVHDNGTDEDN